MSKNYPSKYKFMEDLERDMKKKPKSHIPNKRANHVLFEGGTGTGKTVALKFLQEFGIDREYCKVWDVNVEEFSLLRELLAMAVPYVNQDDPQDKKRMKQLKRYNKKSKKDVSPKGYNVKVFVPVTHDLPDKIPDNFVPFGISVNDLRKWSLRIMFGESYEKYSKIYNDKFRGKDTRLNDLMDLGGEDYETDFYIKKSPLGVERVFVREESQSLEYFMRQINRFKNTEIYAPPEIEDKYALKPKLEEESKNQDTKVVLYTGHIKDEFIRKFILAYFIDSIIQIQDSLKKQDYRNIITIHESQKILKKKREDSATKWDKIITEIFKDSFDDFRRYNIDIWLDTKPNRLPHSIKDNAKKHFLTRVSRGKGLEDILSMYEIDKRNKRKSRGASVGYILNQDQKYIRNYGFIDLNRKIPEWKGTYGYRLPRLIRSSLLEPPVSKDDFSWFIDLCEGYIDTTEILQDFKEAYDKEEEKLRNTVKEIHKKRKKKKEEKEENTKEKRKKKAIEKLKDMVEANGGVPEGVPDEWKKYLTEIMEEIDGISTLRTVQNYTQKVRERYEDKKREVKKTPRREAVNILKENIKDCRSRDERKFIFQDLIESGEISGSWSKEERDQVISRAETLLKKDGYYDENLNPI